MRISGQRQPTAFSTWMRTGRWPRPEATPSVEVKFNPWHDPRNGQFTFGPGGPRSQDHKPSDPIGLLLREDPSLPPITTIEEADAWRERLLGKYGHLRRHREAIEARYQVYKSKVAPRRRSLARQAVEFYTGEAEALLDIGEETIVGAYNLITKPGPTIRGAVTGLVRTADAIINDDTPAYVYFDRAAKWLENASPRELGYAAMKMGGNVGLAAVPGTIAIRISAATRVGELGAFVVAKGKYAEVWNLGIGPRGELIEQAFGHNLTRNFPVIDKFKWRSATSIKSIDLDAPSYLTGNRLKNKLIDYVDKVSAFKGTSLKGWGGITILDKEIKSRGLDLIIPHSGTIIRPKLLLK